MHIRLYVLYVKSLIGGVPRMGSRVPFALLPFGIHIYLSNKVLIIPIQVGSIAQFVNIPIVFYLLLSTFIYFIYFYLFLSTFIYFTQVQSAFVTVIHTRLYN